MTAETRGSFIRGKTYAEAKGEQNTQPIEPGRKVRRANDYGSSNLPPSTLVAHPTATRDLLNLSRARDEGHPPSMRLFLDTEWAVQPDQGVELVSLGLVSEDEQYVFYAECDPLPPEAPDFVHMAVYPLLQRGEFAKEPNQLAEALRDFICKVSRADSEPPVICYDFPMDAQLFKEAWGGLAGAVGCITAPEVRWYSLNALAPHYWSGVERYFSASPDASARRHHALVDARAARAGFLHAMRMGSRT